MITRFPDCPPQWKSDLEAVLGAPWGPDGDVRVVRLFGDGSDRSFYRLRCGKRHFVLLVSPRKKFDSTDEVDSSFHIGRHLFDRDVPVPRIFWSDVRYGGFLLEDLGDTHFERLVRRGRANRTALYRKALAVLLHLHRFAPEGFSPAFCHDSPVYDPDFVLRRELHYFRDAFLTGFLEWKDFTPGFERDLQNLAEGAGSHERRWVIHRDFQSRNLMVWGGRLRVIDYQGMRYGPPAYDLASLLIDPYVGLDRVEEDTLVGLYWQSARRFLGGSKQAFMRSYAHLRLCRNLQALGAYAFLSKVKGKRRFLGSVLPAWRRLRESFTGPVAGRFPDLAKCIRAVGVDLPARRVEETLRRMQLFGDKPT